MTLNQLVSWLMKPIQARMRGFKAVKKASKMQNVGEKPVGKMIKSWI